MPIDWSNCDLVQRDPRYVSGAAALREDPRVMVDPIVEAVIEFGETPEGILEQLGVPLDVTQALLAYAATHRAADPVR